MAKKTDQNKYKTSQKNLDLNCPSTSTKIPETSVLNKNPYQNQQIKNIEKIMADRTEMNMPKTQIPFSFEGEISKIKITMPLTELISQSSYKYQVLKVLNIGNDANTLHLADDSPELLFGQKIEGKY